MRTRTTKRCAGFSLLELSVTLLLIGIFAAVAVPKISGEITSYRLETVSKQIATDLEAARLQSITTSSSQEVQFYISQNKYTLKNMTDINHPDVTQYVVELNDMQGDIFLVSESFPGSTSVVYDQYGKPDHGGSVVIQSGTATKTITVDATTGKVTVL